MDYKNLFFNKNFGKIYFDEPLKNHTTFGIGGLADVFVMPETEEELKAVLEFNYENKINSTIIGKGSNLLISDRGIRGCVICLKSNYSKISITKNEITAQSGALLSDIAKLSVKYSLSGMEELEGIPGTIGGAVSMNAGAYGKEIKNIVKEVRFLTLDGKILVLKNEDINFSYRHSKVFEDNLIVSSAVFKLDFDDKIKIEEKYWDYHNRRLSKQPLDKKSAGSTFKRPEGSFASKLIDESNLRGYRIGDCQISEKHCGFVINNENATCKEMLNFIYEIKRIVKLKTGFDIETEVKIIGDF
ncbi:MAG: UDP-N-acetylmuramate dehydrogenase [Peptoniphilaceae bacterium]|nr:UDP-N-acetylmuramate dehydrogenase [Peptoniphilaceae bacterium]MDD7382871.1 UDP-N-acetylmuramate dehydrogenase [Peptoniphilaceae bacterium]MDY3738170.1 UDP-N-acetylmuramate dehydrogenase [Peptoniphilaceae bacterium]